MIRKARHKISATRQLSKLPKNTRRSGEFEDRELASSIPASLGIGTDSAASASGNIEFETKTQDSTSGVFSFEFTTIVPQS